jgi:hypothetical protein
MRLITISTLVELREIGVRIVVSQYTIVACIKATLLFTVQQITLRLSNLVGATHTLGIGLSLELMTNTHRI